MTPSTPSNKSTSSNRPTRSPARKSAKKAAAQPRADNHDDADDVDDDDVDDNDVDDVADDAAAPSNRHLPDFGDVGDFIREQREKMEMSVRRLSELAGVSNPYLSQIERGLRNPSADILQQVANALRISVESLYVRAGILPDQGHSVSTVPEAIEHDRELTNEQKLALLNVYQSFVTRR